MKRAFHILITFLSMSPSLFADPSTKIVKAPHTLEHQMQIGDLACIQVTPDELECGKVVAIDQKEVTLEVSYESDQSVQVDTPKPAADKPEEKNPYQGEFWKPPVTNPPPAPPKEEVKAAPKELPLEFKQVTEVPMGPPAPIAKVATDENPTLVFVPDTCHYSLRHLANVPKSVDPMPSSPLRESQLLSGLGLGVGSKFYFWPVEVATRLNSKWGIAGSPIFSLGRSTDVSVTVLGGLAHLHYWWEEEGRGWQVLGGLGLFHVAATPDADQTKKQTLTSLTLLGGVGYMYQIPGEDFFLVPRFLLQYVLASSGNDRAIDFKGLKPTLLLEAGVRF